MLQIRLMDNSFATINTHKVVYAKPVTHDILIVKMSDGKHFQFYMTLAEFNRIVGATTARRAA